MNGFPTIILYAIVILGCSAKLPILNGRIPTSCLKLILAVCFEVVGKVAEPMPYDQEMVGSILLAVSLSLYKSLPLVNCLMNITRC